MYDDLIDLDPVPPKHFDSQFGDDIQNDEEHDKEQGADDVDAKESMQSGFYYETHHPSSPLLSSAHEMCLAYCMEGEPLVKAARRAREDLKIMGLQIKDGRNIIPYDPSVQGQIDALMRFPVRKMASLDIEVEQHGCLKTAFLHVIILCWLYVDDMLIVAKEHWKNCPNLKEEVLTWIELKWFICLVRLVSFDVMLGGTKAGFSSCGWCCQSLSCQILVRSIGKLLNGYLDLSVRVLFTLAKNSMFHNKKAQHIDYSVIIGLEKPLRWFGVSAGLSDESFCFRNLCCTRCDPLLFLPVKQYIEKSNKTTEDTSSSNSTYTDIVIAVFY
ncbi:hypothetical protein Tco_1067155 [Tanacetum coccineum]|uniref:Reverse transcriptase Ty1/copia-type domain-containing protein n=1 Tax=Tanacetum coccineum TaxID=301880 RepID=A0ABQ5HCC9_9ASTR